jgi:hypothetical protein
MQPLPEPSSLNAEASETRAQQSSPSKRLKTVSPMQLNTVTLRQFKTAIPMQSKTVIRLPHM